MAIPTDVLKPIQRLSADLLALDSKDQQTGVLVKYRRLRAEAACNLPDLDFNRQLGLRGTAALRRHAARLICAGDKRALAYAEKLRLSSWGLDLDSIIFFFGFEVLRSQRFLRALSDFSQQSTFYPAYRLLEQARQSRARKAGTNMDSIAWAPRDVKSARQLWSGAVHGEPSPEGLQRETTSELNSDGQNVLGPTKIPFVSHVSQTPSERSNNRQEDLTPRSVSVSCIQRHCFPDSASEIFDGDPDCPLGTGHYLDFPIGKPSRRSTFTPASPESTPSRQSVMDLQDCSHAPNQACFNISTHTSLNPGTMQTGSLALSTEALMRHDSREDNRHANQAGSGFITKVIASAWDTQPCNTSPEEYNPTDKGDVTTDSHPFDGISSEANVSTSTTTEPVGLIATTRSFTAPRTSNTISTCSSQDASHLAENRNNVNLLLRNRVSESSRFCFESISHSRLNSESVYSVLERVILATNSTSWYALDPTAIQIAHPHGTELSGIGRLKDHHRMLVAPIHLPTLQHWVLAIVDRDARTIRVFDPLHQTPVLESTFIAVQRFASTILGQPQSTWTRIKSGTKCEQKDGQSCGIHILVYAVHAICQLEMPDTIDERLWRRYIALLYMPHCDIDALPHNPVQLAELGPADEVGRSPEDWLHTLEALKRLDDGIQSLQWEIAAIESVLATKASSVEVLEQEVSELTGNVQWLNTILSNPRTGMFDSDWRDKTEGQQRSQMERLRKLSRMAEAVRACACVMHQCQADLGSLRLLRTTTKEKRAHSNRCFEEMMDVYYQRRDAYNRDGKD